MYLLRTLLFMPGNNQKLLNKIPEIASDAVVLDLEDSVPLKDKTVAREMLAKTITELKEKKSLVIVRTNVVTSKLFLDDLKSVVVKGLDGLVLPKVESTDEIRLASRALYPLEEKNGIIPGSIKLIPTIETALGLLRADSIVGSSERIIAISWGAEDYTLDLGVSRTKEGVELFYPRAYLATVAAANKVQCLDTVFADIGDDDGLVEEVNQIKQLGFHGKYLIHPRQIDLVNQGFAPSRDEVEFAKKAILAFERAKKENLGVVAVDGKMVDPPVYEKAKRVLAMVGSNK